MDYSKRPGRKLEKIGEIMNKSEPVISVITPFYNGGDTLLETAYSLFSQTYPFFEWLIIDDGSNSKKSLKILDDVSKMDSRVRVFHKENGGPSIARDYGISKVNKNSEYIYFLDCDDLIDKTMLECLYWTLKTHPDASFSYAATVNFGDSEFLWEEYLSIAREKKKNLICISSMIKKSDLLEVGCFGISEKSMYEDWNLWLKLLAKGKKPIRVSANLFWYRRSNTGELSRAKKNNKNAMKYVNRTALEVSNNVEVIQFPHFCPKVNQNREHGEMLLPMYEKKTKKNILFLLPWLVIGGADIFNLELIKRLDKNLFDVTIVTTLPTNNVLRQAFEEVSSQIYDLSSFLEVSDYLSFVDYLIESRNITTIFVSNSTYGYSMLPYIKAKYPHVATIDYVHSICYDDGVGGFGRYSADFDPFIDKTLTCNNFTKQQLLDDFNKKNVETVYIGTDAKRFDKTKYDRFKLKEKYQIPSKKKIITFLARLSVEKRPIMFIQIASALLKKRGDVFFLIVGDGPLSSDVKKEILKLGIGSKVKMLGATMTPEEIYTISDVTINCSYLEGLALTSYESLSMSVPIISTSVGGQKELIDESVGRIVECYSKDEIDKYVDATIEVLNNLESLSANASKRIKSQFSYDIMVEKMSTIFANTKGKGNNGDITLGLKKYCTYSMKTYREFNLQVKDYCWKKYHKYMDNEEGIITQKISQIIKYVELLGNRYDCTKELNYFVNVMRFLVKFFGYLYKLFLTCFKFIFSLIMSFFAFFVIVFKILKKEL